MKTASPLRYPGGKWRFAGFFKRLIEINGLTNREYVEPYAGGGSLALSLLYMGLVSRIHLNDLAPSVYSVWWAMLQRSSQLKEFINSVPLTLKQWDVQKEIYEAGPRQGRFRYACSVLYLNRTNHSGILNAGIIGGREQRGTWRMDARFNRSQLARRIDTIVSYRPRIKIHNLDALEFVTSEEFHKRGLVYLDPPYVDAGKRLYLNSHTALDHAKLSRRVASWRGNWVVSYDNHQVVRELYSGFASRRVALQHSARRSHTGMEILFFSDSLRVPTRPVLSPYRARK